MEKNVFVKVYEESKGALTEEEAIAKRKELEKFDPLEGCTLDPQFKKRIEDASNKAEEEIEMQ